MPRTSRHTALLSCLALLLFAASADPLADALLKKSGAELRAVLEAAKARGREITFDADADDDTLRGLLYENAQAEIPGGTPKKWADVKGGAGKPAAGGSARAAKPAGSAAAGGMPAGGMSGMADMLFSKLDKDRDGSLSRAEMQALIDQTNEQARAKGEEEYDLFDSLDANKDGRADRSEVGGFFDKMMGGKKESRLQEGLFAKLDKDGDRRLSREEMRPITEKTAAQQKAAGGPSIDFFADLDGDGDGFIDQAESAAFFKAMEQGGLMPKGQKEEL